MSESKTIVTIPKAQRDADLKTLNGLGAAIRADFAEINELGCRVLDVAIRVGENLTKAKDMLPHGKFGPWVEAGNGGDMSMRKAQLYMQLAEWKGQIKNVLTITDAVRVINEKKNAGKRKTTDNVEDSEEWWKHHAEESWKQWQARYVDAIDEGESWLGYIGDVDEDGNLDRDSNKALDWAAGVLIEHLPYLVKRAAKILYPDVEFPKDDYD